MKTRKLRGPPMRYSEVILRFGEPLLRLAASEDAPRSARKDVLSIVVLLWNAMVVDEALGGTRYLDEVFEQLPAMTGPHGAAFSAAVHELVDRKRTAYADQCWTVGRWELLGDGADLRLRIEARAPPERTER